MRYEDDAKRKKKNWFFCPIAFENKRKQKKTGFIYFFSGGIGKKERKKSAEIFVGERRNGSTGKRWDEGNIR